MATLKFDNTLAGWAQINALPNPKHPIISGARVTVLTGTDVPPDAAAADPSSIVLTTHQLHSGALAIGQTRLNELKALIASPPTPAVGLYLGMSQAIARSSPRVNQARTTLGWSAALMDSIFVAGSGMDP